MKPLLFWIQPLDPVTNQRVNVRLGSVPSPIYSGLGGFTWEGAVSRRPRFMQDLMSPKLDGKVLTGRGDFMVNLNHVLGVAEPKGLNWSGAPITVWDATSLDPANVPVEFSGIVANAQLDIWTGQIILNLEVDIGRLDRPLLTGEFTGGGGLLGDADKRGTPWPAGFGYVENCEPVWFDLVNNVGMLDGYSNLTTVHGLFEGGDDRGASFGDYASYALLVAAPIPEGRWATCLTAGLVRLGAPPAGRISCDCTFRGPAGTGANRPGALIRRILETHAGIATGSIDIAAMAALDTAVPRNVHYWTPTQRQVQNLVEAIAASCNAQCLILLNGLISVTRAFGGANVGTVNRTGTSTPPITDWQLAQPEESVWRMRARTNRPGTVFTFDELLYEDDLIDMGAFDVTIVYRQGNLVWMPNGSQWLFINLIPSSGHTPPSVGTSDAWWQRTRAPTTAADLVYGDGTTIESLKPGMAGATRNIIYQSATDPVLAVAINNGDIWVDTSVTPWKVKTRIGGAWVASANYVTQGSDIGVANGATVNIITYLGTAPASPVNGDIWVDTSVTPNVVRVRVGGAWQASSNLVTQGTDIGVANNAGTTVNLTSFGTTAATISGNGFFKPSGANGYDCVVRSDKLSGPCFIKQKVTPGANWNQLALDVNATGDTPSAQLFHAEYYPAAGFFNIRHGGTTVQSLTITVDLTGEMEIRYDGRVFKVLIGGVQRGTDVTALSASYALYPKWWAYQAGAGAAITGLDAGYVSDQSSTGATIDVAKEIIIKCDNAYAPKTGELTRNVVVRLLKNGVTQGSGLTWTYEVLSGGINSKTAASGLISISGAGAVTFAITSLQASDTQVRLKAVDAAGISFTEVVRVVKLPDPPPVGGTGGGTSSSDTVDVAISSTTYGAAVVTLRAKAGPGGRVDLTAPLDFVWWSVSLGSRASHGKWQWSTIGGSPADVVSEIASTLSASNYNDVDSNAVNSPGHLPCTTFKTGLTSGTEYEFTLFLRSDTASTTLSFTGAASAVGS